MWFLSKSEISVFLNFFVRVGFYENNTMTSTPKNFFVLFCEGPFVVSTLIWLIKAEKCGFRPNLRYRFFQNFSIRVGFYENSTMTSTPKNLFVLFCEGPFVVLTLIWLIKFQKTGFSWRIVSFRGFFGFSRTWRGQNSKISIAKQYKLANKPKKTKKTQC